jgi:quinohemoprotein ethanol dehydrogenase
MVRIFLFLGVIVVFLTACGRENGNAQAPTDSKPAASRSMSDSAAAVDARRIINADSEPQNWLSHGRTYSEQRYSPLDRINDKNAGRLGLAWYKEFPGHSGLEATPLVVNGVLYTTAPWNVIHALDAATGRELWRYDPQVPRSRLRYSCCGPINRGLALWRGRLYEGTLDGRLIAVDAATGKLVWQVQTTPRDQPYSITGAPRVVDGKVVIGNSGAEYPVRGYVTAYDAETGKQVWRFYTVPGNPADGFESDAMAMAARTWHGEWWRYGGGGVVWDSFAYDPDLNLLYFGTGNGGPWSRHARSAGRGDNLFICSIVAVDAATGRYVWHYQTAPGDSWDYDATQPLILADLKINGAPRKVLMQASKNGFFYVLDRKTGELISAQNFVPVSWTTGIDMKTGRPEIPAIEYYKDGVVYLRPGPIGGHNWKSMSYDPQTGLVYIPTLETFFSYGNDPSFKYTEGIWNLAQDPALITPGADLPPPPDWPVGAHLTAWDPVTQKEVWRIPDKGLWNGGVLTTAGNLLIQGAADGRLRVYRADNGRELWHMPVQTGIIAAPVTYEVKGEQYIAVSAGWGGTWATIIGARPVNNPPLPNDRLLVFKLGGEAHLPPPPSRPPWPRPPPAKAPPQEVSKGAVLYNKICYACHGFAAVSGGTFPDLRRMTPETHARFDEIVLGGALAANGMGSFADVLSKADAEAIHAYLISRANQDWRQQAEK